MGLSGRCWSSKDSEAGEKPATRKPRVTTALTRKADLLVRYFTVKFYYGRGFCELDSDAWDA